MILAITRRLMIFTVLEKAVRVEEEEQLTVSVKVIVIRNAFIILAENIRAGIITIVAVAIAIIVVDNTFSVYPKFYINILPILAKYL